MLFLRLTGASGSISLSTGTASAGASGTITVATGASTGGTSGTIILSVGAGESSAGGSVVMQAGSVYDMKTENYINYIKLFVYLNLLHLEGITKLTCTLLWCVHPYILVCV